MEIILPVADQRGLWGLSLDGRLRRAFGELPAETIYDLAQRVREEAERRQLLYYRDGQPEIINVMLRPSGIFPEQMQYFHYVSLTLLSAHKRMPDLYLLDPSVREAVPLSPEEERWLRETWGPEHSAQHTVIGRLDAMIDFTSPSWKEALHFMEPNLVGMGGVHLVPTLEDILQDVVVPALRQVIPKLDLQRAHDLRELFIQELLDHADQIGRPGGSICFVDPKYEMDGPNELATLTQYYRSRGISVSHADPRELRLVDGEVFHQDRQIDVAYRDYELSDLIDLEEEGVDIRPIQQLFRRNQMISSLAGDLDHKSCFEVFTDPRFAGYFTPEQHQVFRRHVLWTRVLRERKTTDPYGEVVDLVEHARHNRDRLVIKPNRSYGGTDVLIGPSVEETEWDQAIEAALSEPGSRVVQSLARLIAQEFPVITEDNSISVEPFYMVCGFCSTKYGMGILGRASQRQVVNVAQRGGMCAVMVGRISEAILAPAAPR